MTVVDMALAVAGASHAVASDGGRAGRRATVLAGALFLLTVVPALAISLTPIPLERTFDELRLGSYRERTSWLRLEGDLRDAGESSRGERLYTLHDPADETVAVTVVAPGPLPTGHVDVTGRPLGGVRLPGTFEAFWADVPTEPARQDPWPLIALPACLGAVVVVGGQVGYPVMRREQRRALTRTPQSDEPIRARRYGRLDGDDLPDGRSRPCTVTVIRKDTSTLLRIAENDGAIHEVATLHATPKVVGRACRITGCHPALELHAPAADAILEFESVADRDRLAAAVT